MYWDQTKKRSLHQLSANYYQSQLFFSLSSRGLNEFFSFDTFQYGDDEAGDKYFLPCTLPLSKEFYLFFYHKRNNAFNANHFLES